MRLALRDVFECNPRSVAVTYRLTLLKDDTFRLPPTCANVHVLSGNAWVTSGGKDIVLEVGEKASFATEKDTVFISALGHVPLNLEVRGDHRLCPNCLRAICVKGFLKRFLRETTTGR